MCPSDKHHKVSPPIGRIIHQILQLLLRQNDHVLKSHWLQWGKLGEFSWLGFCWLGFATGFFLIARCTCWLWHVEVEVLLVGTARTLDTSCLVGVTDANVTDDWVSKCVLTNVYASSGVLIVHPRASSVISEHFSKIFFIYN